MSSAARIRLAAFVLFLGIALGAFGAHGLADRLEATGRLDNWETAGLYHLVHGLALFVIALRPGRPLGYYWFLAGILIFSGSLYALALTDITKLGAITPLGGISFLVGWGRWIFHRPSPSGETAS
ncbi:MAG: DUF423 domain-containing protein [Verrucomicrobiaceae bacterium]|nr:DUF423 domain-containing protein [Verrucomicrobiaceae bacterium]